MAISTNGNIYAGVEGNHLIGLGGVPTVALGPGAGAGSAVVTGTDTSCTVTLTAGAGTAPNSVVFTITFNTSFMVTPHTVCSAKNANTSANTARMFVTNTGTASFDLNITNPALTSGRVYSWTFTTLG